MFVYNQTDEFGAIINPFFYKNFKKNFKKNSKLYTLLQKHKALTGQKSRASRSFTEKTCVWVFRKSFLYRLFVNLKDEQNQGKWGAFLAEI